jgi:hypothetical protein
MTTESREALQTALDAGHTSINDEGTRRHMMAICPDHGAPSPVSMPIKEGRRIVEIIFRCPVDGERFRVPLDQVFLG